jgi:hypothetical protein
LLELGREEKKRRKKARLISPAVIKTLYHRAVCESKTQKI